MNIVTLNKYDTNSTEIKFFHQVAYIQFSALSKLPYIQHGFSTRLGGVSKGHLSGMNLGFGRDDNKENVIKNHEIIAEAMGFEAKNIVCSDQTHTTNVRVVTKEDCGKGIYLPKDYHDIDGLITNERDVVLVTYFADCVPLYLVDTKNKAIGLSHSGWRGTVSKMGEVTLLKMHEVYGTNPEDVIACIGPSICQDCYEISKDVAEEFKKAFPNHVHQILKEKSDDKYHLNLWKCNQIVLKEAGILTENIHMTDLCTCCNKEVLFSHRGHHGKRGNLAAFLSLRT